MYDTLLFIIFKSFISFRFVTPPLIQSGRKHLTSLSKILANRTLTSRWLLQKELLSIKRCRCSKSLMGCCLSSFWTDQVKDADRVQALGSLTIPLSRLLSTPDLSLDQWFQLDKAGSASRIYIKAVLRVNGSNTHALILPIRPEGSW